MAVLIKGIEMPKEIEPALVIDFCEDLDGKRYARFYHYRYGGLTGWHEVLEIPEPHGDLIDREGLQDIIGQLNLNWEYGQGVSDCWDALLDAPAIIPASEGGET